MRALGDPGDESRGGRGLAGAGRRPRLRRVGTRPRGRAGRAERWAGRRGPGLVASAAARALEERLAAHLPEATVASRGSFCHLALPADGEGLERAPAALALVRDSLGVVRPAAGPAAAGARVPRARARRRPASRRPRSGPGSGGARRPRPDRSRHCGCRGQEAARLGLFPARPVRRPAPRRGRRPLAAAAAAPGGRRAAGGGGVSERPERLRRLSRGEDGQVLPLALGGCFVLIAGALALVAIAGAVTGKGRVQRAADLAAISAARSMRDDLPRLLSPPTLPDGLPNPAHMEKAVYLWRARAAAYAAAKANGVGPLRLRVSFPDMLSFAPVRARATILGELRAGSMPRPGHGLGRRRSRGAAGHVARWRDAVDGERRRLFGAARLPRRRGHAPRRRRRLRPHGGRRRRRGHRPPGQLRLSLERRTGAALRRPPRSEVGRAAGPVAASLRHRARSRSRIRLLLARRQRLTVRLRPALLLGAVALRAAPSARRPAPTPAMRSARSVESTVAVATGSCRAAPACRPSCPPASGSRCCGPRRAGTSPPRCWPRS